VGFDLGVIETRKYAEEGVFFPVLHPKTGEPLKDDAGSEIKIKISGGDASRIKSAVEERQAARKALDADAKKGEVVEYNWQMREQDIVDDLVLLTEGWTDNVELDGKPLAFSKVNARILYQRFPEIAEQMSVRATNRLNFMPTSANK
jgi:hypothetical protein